MSEKFKLVFTIGFPIRNLIWGIALTKGNPQPKIKEAKLRAFELVGDFLNDSRFAKKVRIQNPIE